jgi:hypothetical protein
MFLMRNVVAFKHFLVVFIRKNDSRLYFLFLQHFIHILIVLECGITL